MAQADLISSADVIQQFDQYVISNYRRYPVCLVRGEGSLVWDAEGRRYVDFFPGWGCNLVGHCPPRVVEAVTEQVRNLIHVPNTWYMEAQGQFAKALSERSFGGKAFFCNSGAEANEAAIKLARAYGHPQNRSKIVTMFHGFHGRTYAALSATAQPKYHVGFEPIVPGFEYVPFGDLDAVEKAVDSQTAAVMLEPIQGEGGINIPPDNYLAGLREICDRTGALLIFDEVQTGMGRTGKWFAHQHFGVTPDIMTVAKALASGVSAGVMMATHPVAEVLKPGMHASTYGGNPIACRAGLATIETIESEGLLESAKILESKFRSFFEGLQAKRPDLIRAIRIRGVMVGVELSCDASPIVAECMKRQLLINATQGNVIRLLPALNLTEELMDEGCSILSDVLLSYRPTEDSQS